MRRHSRAVATIAFLFIGFCCFGCRPADLLDERVAARTSLDLIMWRAHIAARQTPQERRELDDMIQELKFSVMLKGTATGSEAIDEAVREEIDGVTLRDVLLKGHEAERRRLLVEKARLEACIDANAQRRTRPGDVASAGYLDHLREQQMARLEAIDLDLGIAHERMNKPGDVARPEPVVEDEGDLDEKPQLLTTGGH
jgi:hypothetical protein